jgi:hypothetical protein
LPAAHEVYTPVKVEVGIHTFALAVDLHETELEAPVEIDVAEGGGDGVPGEAVVRRENFE